MIVECCFLAAKGVNYLLVKFLLCLSNIEDMEANSQGVPDFCHRFSNCNEMCNDVQLVRFFIPNVLLTFIYKVSYYLIVSDSII